MRIACVYHPKPYLQNPTAQYGLGLLALATLAKACGQDVSVIDGQGCDADWMPPKTDAHVWLLSACLVDTPIINRLIKHADCDVIVGGPISHSPEAVSDASIIWDGPGEPLIEELCTGNNKPLDFNRYPIPDRSLLHNYGGNIYHPHSGVEASVSTTLLTSRGCNHRCAFCTSGNKDVCIHEYPISRIEQELEQIVGLGITDVRISDDNIMASPTRLRDVCRLLRDAQVRWRASVRVSDVTEDVYEDMAASGCVEVSFGVESADPDVLRLLRKGTTVAQSRLSITRAISAGLHVRMLMMMGTPGERPETLEFNKQFVGDLPDAVVSLAIFYPFPGTEIHQHPAKYGCTLRTSDDPNICGFRPNGSEPEANIEIIGGMSRDKLTKQFLEMRDFLVEHNQNNRG